MLGVGLETGDMFWVWRGYGSQTFMHSVLGGLFSVFETVLSDQCLVASKETLCDSHYARCLEVENEETGEVIPTPQLLCNARCRDKADRCGVLCFQSAFVERVTSIPLVFCWSHLLS
jgi:hypothetical protein